MKKSQGFSLLEILIAISFIAVASILVFTISSSNNKLRKLNEEKTQALFYASQAVEVAKLIDWSSLAVGDYHLQQSANTWALAAGSELLNNKYTRLINIGDVTRASSTNGQAYGPFNENGFVDPDTKKLTVTMTWASQAGANRQEVIESYLYRWQADRWSQTDWSGNSGQTDWSDPTKFFTKDSSVDVAIPGIATLVSGFLDWNQATTTDTFNTAGNFDDNDVYELNDLAYLVTEDNAYGDEFYVLNVADVYNVQQSSSLNIGFGVTAVVVKDKYAFLSTRSNSGELKVVQVTNPDSPAVRFTYNLPGNSDARDLVVNENELYIVQSDDLYAFSIVNPLSPVLLDSVDVDGIVTEVFVSEDNVYLATEKDNKELQIVDITNPANLQVVGLYNLPGSLKGSDVNVQGNRAYISTQNNGSGREFFIFDISDPSNPQYIGDYEVGETVYSFGIVGPYALLGTNFLNEELVVIDVSFPATVSKVSGFDLSGHILGMSANCSTIYAATSSNQEEFFVISTQVADCGYAPSGTLESSTFDTGSDQVSYNWIAWTGSAPLNTSIRLQLASSNSIGGPWNFVGPDGTGSSYYTNASQEQINYNAHINQRYIRYKLFLDSSASFQAPILEEVIISYSEYP